MSSPTLPRFLAAAALIVMGSCAATPDTHPQMTMADGAVNHPIMVEPSYRALKLNWNGGLSQPEAVVPTRSNNPMIASNPPAATGASP